MSWLVVSLIPTPQHRANQPAAMALVVLTISGCVVRAEMNLLGNVCRELGPNDTSGSQHCYTQ